LKVPPGSRCIDQKTSRRLAAPERPARQPQRRRPNHIIEATERRQLQITSLKRRGEDMRPILTLIFTLTVSIASQSAVAQSDMIDGQVTKVDQSAGKITIKHGPAKRLGMESGMTMVYKAQDPAMLKAVKAGNKIKFDAEQVNGQYTVTKIELAK
jgi:Cu/Ag efflux protein CusF